MNQSSGVAESDPFASFSRVPLGNWPTPVRRLDITSEELGIEVWAKVEDGSGTWAANKARKLEYLLAEARDCGRKRVFAYGVGSSSWCAAVARYAPEDGFDVHIALAGRVPEHLAPLYDEVTSRRLPTYASAPVVTAWGRLRAGRAYRLPAGGSGGIGDVGSARAGIEIANAIAAGELPDPTRAFVASGTCGSAAGLAVGMAALSRPVPVTAVRVTPRPLGGSALLHRRIQRLRKRLGMDTTSPLEAEVDERFHAPGYGRSNRHSEEARAIAARDGLELDVTYGAKAFAALVDAARTGASGPLLFLSTSTLATRSI